LKSSSLPQAPQNAEVTQRAEEEDEKGKKLCFSIHPCVTTAFCGACDSEAAPNSRRYVLCGARHLRGASS
jgi:hypothetical protein